LLPPGPHGAIVFQQGNQVSARVHNAVSSHFRNCGGGRDLVPVDAGKTPGSVFLYLVCVFAHDVNVHLRAAWLQIQRGYALLEMVGAAD
jgi:hypothetical protein